MSPATPFDSGSILIFICLLVAPLAIAGVGFINTGLGRSRNAAHAMMAALCVFAIAACVWFAWGASVFGKPGTAGHIINMFSKPWDWLGSGSLFLLNADPGMLVVVWLTLIGAALAAQIPLGSASDRWKLSSASVSTVLLAGVTFPLFGHWAWGGGWLAQLGTNFSLGRGFLDLGGAGSIHAVGGLTALAVTWIVGPRRGRYTSDGMPMAIPGHNVVLVLFGCITALAGWLGLNAAGAMLFGGVPADRIPLIGVNTILAAAGGAWAASITTRVRFGKPDASLTGNGWMSGLVTSSALAALVPPAAALLCGLIAGALVTISVEMLDLKLEIDDPCGAISVHGVAGLWGLLAVGLFGRYEASAPGQGLAQLVGVATLIGFVLPLAWGLNTLLDRVQPQRVTAEGEYQGMDLHELGAGAYPEFVIHADDFMPR